MIKFSVLTTFKFSVAFIAFVVACGCHFCLLPWWGISGMCSHSVASWASGLLWASAGSPGPMSVTLGHEGALCLLTSPHSCWDTAGIAVCAQQLVGDRGLFLS